MTARLGLRINKSRQIKILAQAIAKQKLLTVVFILLMGVVGYRLAPTDLATGDYLAEFTVQVNGERLTAEFPFTLGQEAGESVVATTTNGRYQLTIEGQEAIKYELGQAVTYRLQLTNAAGRPIPLSLEQATSTITSISYKQVLPPTGQADGWLTFNMRLPYKAKITTALLFTVAALWLAELVPLAATAFLIPIVIVTADVAEASTILQPFAHPIIVLFLAGFLLAEGMKRTGVDRLLALLILRRASLQPVYLMLTMMSLTAVLSMWMSNTASVAIVIPIALAVLEKIPKK